MIRETWSTLFEEWGAGVQVDVMPDETASHLSGGVEYSIEAEQGYFSLEGAIQRGEIRRLTP